MKKLDFLKVWTLLFTNMGEAYHYQNLLFLHFKHHISRKNDPKFYCLLAFLCIWSFNIFCQKQWILRNCNCPSLDRYFVLLFKKFRKKWFKSISLRLQAFIWYQICKHLNCSLCHFILLAKSPFQPSVECRACIKKN